MNNRRLLVSLTGLLVVAGLLAGCSGGSVPPASESATPQESTAPSGAAEQETTPPASATQQETTPPASTVEQEATPPASPVWQVTGPLTEHYTPRHEDGVDVVYFETSNPCSCMAEVGDAIEHAVLKHFQDELQNGELRFFLLVSNAPGNMDVVKEFNSQPFDLFIVEYEDGQGVVEPVYDIWSLTGDDEAIMDFVHTRVLSSLEDQK